MKYIAILVLTGLALIGCSDYSSQVDADYEEWRETQLELAMDSITATIKPDTVTIRHIDTVKTTVTKVDTVKKTIRDTLVVNKTKYDTITVNNTVVKVDTVVKSDTLVKTNTIHDTVIINQTDTLVTNDTLIIKDTVIEVHKIANNQEILRDTAISLSIEQDGATITRIFHGKVANGVFYDTTLYEYGFTCGLWCRDNGTCWVNTSGSFPTNATRAFSDAIFPSGSTNCSVGTYYYLGHQLVDRSGYGRGTDTVMVNKCGLLKSINQPYVTSKDTTRFPGWRTVSEKDIKWLGNEIEVLIPQDSAIFLSESVKTLNTDHPACSGSGCHNYIQSFRTGSDTYVANVATQYGITTKEKPTRYMCAYDLNKSK